MSVKHVTAAAFQSEVLDSQKPVLLDFWATWCGPCRMVAPILEEIDRERTDIQVCKVDVDEEPALAAKFGIVSIPTLMAVKDGQVVNQLVGAYPKEQILAMFS